VLDLGVTFAVEPLETNGCEIGPKDWQAKEEQSFPCKTTESQDLKWCLRDVLDCSLHCCGIAGPFIATTCLKMAQLPYVAHMPGVIFQVGRDLLHRRRLLCLVRRERREMSMQLFRT
jgi:hypothetical protein